VRNFKVKEKFMNYQCPTCTSYINIQDGVGYCIFCDDIVVETEDETENNPIDINDLPF